MPHKLLVDVDAPVGEVSVCDGAGNRLHVTV